MHPDVTAVTVELDAHRSRFNNFCRSLSADELMRRVPGSSWIVKDFIAHLATIDEPVEAMFRGIHEGNPVGLNRDGGRWDVDAWNEGAVQARRRTSLENLLDEAATRRVSIEATMAQFTQDDLEFVMTFGGDAKRPAGKVQLLAYLKGWCKHDPMHVVDMMRALPEHRSPELEAWFDDPAILRYQSAMNPGNTAS